MLQDKTIQDDGSRLKERGCSMADKRIAKLVFLCFFGRRGNMIQYDYPSERFLVCCN